MKKLIEKILESVEKENEALTKRTRINGEEKIIYCNPEAYKTISPSISEKSGVFIDGGNTELFETSGFSVSLIRIASIKMKEHKVLARDKFEFFLLATIKEDRVVLDAYPEKYCAELGALKVNMMQLSVQGIENESLGKLKLSEVASVVRRLFELKEAIKKSNDADYVFIDGTLGSIYPQETELYEDILKLKIIGISKTTSLRTINGVPLGYAVLSQYKGKSSDTWSFKLPVKQPFSYIMKLSEDDRTVRTDMYDEEFLQDVTQFLVRNASDPLIHGYPYGLIDADQDARITNEEKEMYKTEILMAAGRKYKILESLMKSSDTHKLLDLSSF